MPSITDQSTVNLIARIFCDPQLGNRNITRTLLKAGYSNAYAKEGGRGCSVVFGNVRIKAAIAKLDAVGAAKTGYSIEQAQKEYEEDRQLARKLNQPAAAVSAVTGKARLYALDKDAGGGERTVIVIAPKVVSAKPIISEEI